MRDSDLRDAAVREFRRCTVGYVNEHWKTPPAGTYWFAAEALLAQITGTDNRRARDRALVVLHRTTSGYSGKGKNWSTGFAELAFIVDPVLSGGSIWPFRPADSAVAKDSAVRVQTLLEYAVPHSPNLALSAYGCAIGVAGPADPIVTIPLTKQGGTITFRNPVGLRPAPGTDGHWSVTDLVTGMQTDLWQAEMNAAGLIFRASAGVSFPTDSVNEKTTGWGGDAANLALDAGLILASEGAALWQGVPPDHWLTCGLPQIGSGPIVYPALHNAPTGGGDPLHMREGQWLAMRPEFDPATRTMRPWERGICLTLQGKTPSGQGGMFVRDNSGTFTIYAENGQDATWRSAGFAKDSARFFSPGFPWDQLIVLDPPAKL